jgi:peptidoglycan/LPS O-acetylase OafA/YrhL
LCNHPVDVQVAGHAVVTLGWMARSKSVRAAALLLLGLGLSVVRPSLDGQPSKYVHVRWRPDVSAVERWWLEQRFSLREEQHDGRSFGYDLLDDSSANVKALLQHFAVEDSASLDRVGFRVSPDAETGSSRTGVAWRWRLEAGLPFLRPVGFLLVFFYGATLLHLAFSGSVFHVVTHDEAHSGRAPRFVELDVLRGIAAILVVLFHFTSRFGSHYGHATQPFVTVPLGFYGVHVFFVISGMVIFLTIEKSRSAVEFVVARLGRLFPAYWVAATITFIVVTTWGLPAVTISTPEYLWNLTMAQRFFQVADVDGVYWTLQVELAFYLVMLALVMCRAIVMIEPVLLGWLAVLTLDFANGFLMREGLETSATQLVSLYGYAPLFIVGIALHLRRTGGLSPALAVVIPWAIGLFAWCNGGEAATVFIGTVAAVELAIRGHLAWLVNRPLLFLGAVSYPLYLVHQNVGYVMMRAMYAGGLSTNATIMVAIVSVVAIAALVHVLVEAPGQALARSVRGRIVRRPSRRG